MYRNNYREIDRSQTVTAYTFSHLTFKYNNDKQVTRCSTIRVT